MDEEENIVDFLKAINNNIGEERILPEVYNAEAMDLEQPKYFYC